MVSNPFSDGLTVEIGADASGLTSVLAGASSSLKGFEGQVAAIGSALAALSAGGLAASISAAGDFEQAMTESMAVVGDVSADVEEQMESTARTVAQETKFSAEETAEAFYFLASAGLDAEEQMAALPDVANFAAAGNLEMAAASDYASDIMAAFGYEADELDKVMDTLTGTFTNHNQTAEGMGEAMSYVAPVASSMGLSIEEASAAIGHMGDQGIKGSRAGTALRQALSSLASPSENQAKVLHDLGVEVENSEGNMRDFTEIIRDLEDAGASSGEVMDLFGTRAGPAMQALLADGADALEESTAKIEESGGITEEVAEGQLDNFNSQWMILKNNIEDVFIEIGQALLPALTELVEMVSEAVIWFGEINAQTDGWLGALTLITGLITGVTTAGYALISMFGGLAAVKATVVGLTTALTGVLSGIVAPILGVVAAIGVLAVAWNKDFAGIQTRTMEVVGVLREALQPAIDWLAETGVEVFDTIREAVSEFVELSLPYVEEFVDLLADGLIVTLEILADVFSTAFDVISEVLTTVWDNVLKPFLSWSAEMWDKHLSQPVEEASKTLTAAWELWEERLGRLRDEHIDPFLEWFDETTDAVLGDISDWWDDHGERVIEIASFTFDQIQAITEGFIATVSDLFSAFFAVLRGDWDTARENVLSIVDRLVGGVVDLFSWLYDMLVGNSIVPDMLSDILTAITNTDVKGAFFDVLETAYVWVRDTAAGQFLDAGKGLIDALVDGITDAPGAVKDAVSGVVGEARDMLPFSDAKEGPFSQLTDMGASIPETLASGAEGNFDRLKDALGAGSVPLPVGAASGSGGGDTILNLEIDARGADSPQQVRRAGDDVMNKLKREFDSGL